MKIIMESSKPNLFIKNRQGYTPVTLATHLANADVCMNLFKIEIL